MNILHLYKTFYPDSLGGIELVIKELASRASLTGDNATVLTLSSSITQPEKIVHEGITVIRYPTDIEIAATPFSSRLWFDFRKLQKEFDLVHFQFPFPFGDLLLLQLPRTKPLVISYQSDIVKQRFLKIVYWPLMLWTLNKAKIIVASSPQYLESSSVLELFRHKTTVIPLGIDISNNPSPQAEVLKDFKKRFGERFFCFIGVFRQYKGLEFLIKAATEFNDANIVLIGDGPQRLFLEQLVANLKLKNIHFLGRVDQQTKVNFLSAAYAFVFPSHLRSEAFGLSMAEAAAYAKPLISCRLGTGTSYINNHGISGIEVSPGNSSELAQAMNHLLASPDLAAVYGQAAQERQKTLLNASDMAKKYHEVYQTIGLSRP